MKIMKILIVKFFIPNPTSIWERSFSFIYINIDFKNGMGVLIEGIPENDR
jgi:hypothetical protein